MLSAFAIAQTGMIKGKIVHEENGLPYVDVVVTLPKAKVSMTTGASGEYTFSKIPYGTYEMMISADGVEDVTVSVTVSASVNNIDDIRVQTKVKNATADYNVDNSVTNVEDASSDDDNSVSSGGQNVASVLNSARDPFLSAATFGWGQYFFRNRGYETTITCYF